MQMVTLQIEQPRPWFPWRDIWTSSSSSSSSSTSLLLILLSLFTLLLIVLSLITPLLFVLSLLPPLLFVLPLLLLLLLSWIRVCVFKSFVFCSGESFIFIPSSVSSLLPTPSLKKIWLIVKNDYNMIFFQKAPKNGIEKKAKKIA